MPPVDASKKNQDLWVKIFDVPEVKLHRDGYTIYKISSTVFQREYPEAATSLHVWRRYSSIRHLHKDILKLHMKLGLPGDPPQFAKPPLLTNRFDEAVIQNRRKTTLELLQHCALYSALFYSEQFTNFFKEENEASPKKKLYFRRQKSQESILPSSASPENLERRVPSQVNHFKVSDNYCSDVSLHLLQEEEDGLASSSSVLRAEHLIFRDSILNNENDICTGAISNSMEGFSDEDSLKFSSNCGRPILSHENHYPNTQLNDPEQINEEKMQYLPSNLLDANVLLVQNREEVDRSLLRRKTVEYYHKAEQLMTRFSFREAKVSQVTEEKKSCVRATVTPFKQPISYDSYLKNYRIIGLAGKCILAVDKLTDETVAIKIIEKGETDFKLVPPCHIPYMVPIIRYHEGENAVYIVLKYIRGAKLWDNLCKYMKQPPLSFLKNSQFIYTGKRFLCTSDEPEASSNKISANEQFALEEDEISDTNSFSIDLQLAAISAECRSTIENFNPPFTLDERRYQSSLLSLNPLPEQSLISDCYHRIGELSDFSQFIPEDVKSKSFDNLYCQRVKAIKLERPNEAVKSNNSFNNFEYDNDSIGSGTLSGMSDDFSCSIPNPTIQSSVNNESKLCSKDIQSCVNGMTINNNLETFHVNNMIKNSKKLLEEVAATLEKSKRQFISKVSSGKNKDYVGSSLSFNERDYIIPDHKINSLSSGIKRQEDASSSSFSKLLDAYSANHGQGKGSTLPEGLVRVWLSQVVSSFEALHYQGFIWGDFNHSNILLDDGGSILVTYYCEWASNRRRRYFFPSSSASKGLESWTASMGYIAPELFLPLSTLSFASDWWSVGALLFHLLTGEDVATAHPSGINSHTKINVPSYLSNEATTLINSLLCAHPSERLGGSLAGAQEIKAHPFFYGIQWTS